MVSDFGSTTVSIDDLRSGHVRDSLAEADVVIAVDAYTQEEEVVYGRRPWEHATETGQDEGLFVLRVELEMDTDDLEWLMDAIEDMESGESLEDADDYASDDED